MNTRSQRWHMRALVAAVLAATMAIGTASIAGASGHSTLSRKQADLVALRVLRTTKLREPKHVYIVLYGLLRALRAGSVVSQATLGLIPNGGRAIKLRHPAWLFWEDLNYDAKFVHPSVMLLVDANSGRVVAKRDLELYPLVGGKMPVFLTASDAMQYWVAWDIPKRAAAADTLSRMRVPVTYGAHVAAGSYSNAGFISIVDDRTPGWQKQQNSTDANVLTNTFSGKGIPTAHATSLDELNDSVSSMESKGKNNVTIFLEGHGAPAPGTVDSEGHLIKSGATQPTVALGPGGGVVTAADLNKLMADHPNTKFNFIVGSCFSGRFQPGQENGLNGPNLGTVSTSSAPNEYSYFNDESTDQPDGFASGTDMALNNAFNSDTTGDIDNVLMNAKAMEPSFDPDAKDGSTHPNSTTTYTIPGTLSPSSFNTSGEFH
jgi:hypothetical protein